MRISSKTSKDFFKYCPHCRAAYQPGDDFHCRQCGFTFYQNAKPTGTAFIHDAQKRLLMAQRTIEPRQGWWDMPGGFLEEGEHPINGTKREIQEELGVTITIERQLGIYMDQYEYSYQFHTLNIIYVATIVSGTPQGMDDIGEIRWFTKGEIPWPRLAFSWIHPALRDYYKK